MKRWAHALMILWMSFGSWQLVAAERQPSLKIKAEDNWLFGRPENFKPLAGLYQRHGCRVTMFAWYIYDSQAEQLLHPDQVKTKFPDIPRDHNRQNCEMNVSATEISEVLQIKLPVQPGPVLIYIDFWAPEYLNEWLPPAEIAKQQTELDGLSAYHKIPKYYILTPSAGAN